jgi:hypothetical protein
LKAEALAASGLALTGGTGWQPPAAGVASGLAFVTGRVAFPGAAGGEGSTVDVELQAADLTVWAFHVTAADIART